MGCFVAFLRGINVGGHIVLKEALQNAFNSLGFQNVVTYKQTGNVIFETKDTNPQEIKIKIEDYLKRTLGFEVPVFLRIIPQLKEILTDDPFKNQNSEGTSFLVTFLSAAPTSSLLSLPATIPKSTVQILAVKGMEVFSVTHGGGEGALPNPFLEQKLKVKATTRNINVLKEIVNKFG
jgi:uncharacterized protein (DUF1697 family)